MSENTPKREGSVGGPMGRHGHPDNAVSLDDFDFLPMDFSPLYGRVRRNLLRTIPELADDYLRDWRLPIDTGTLR